MIELFVEAIRDLLLPCSLTVVAPAVAAVLATRRDPLPVYAGALLGSVLIGWMRISEQIPTIPDQPLIAAMGVAVAIGFGALALSDTRRAQRVTASLAIGGATAWVWKPCVGEELGEILGMAPVDPFGAVVPFFVFMLGLSTPALIVALTSDVVSIPSSITMWLSKVSTVFGWIVGVLIATEIYTEVVAQLVLWSL